MTKVSANGSNDSSSKTGDAPASTGFCRSNTRLMGQRLHPDSRYTENRTYHSRCNKQHVGRKLHDEETNQQTHIARAYRRDGVGDGLS